MGTENTANTKTAANKTAANKAVAETTGTDRCPEDLARLITDALSGDMDPELREGLELMQKGLAGDVGAADAAMLVIARIPNMWQDGATMSSFAEKHVDPVELARQALLKAVHGDLNVLQQLGRDKLDAVERDLAGPDPTPIERLLAQQAAICWLELYHFERKYAPRLNVTPGTPEGFVREAFYQKQVSRAQGRFQSALKCLAQVRRLQLPTLQVNVAKNQINVGSGQVKVGEAQVNVLTDAAGEG